MKVLVTGRAIPHQPDRSTGQQLQQGFIQAGHECVFYGNFYGQMHNFLGHREVQSCNFDLVVVTEMNDGMPGYETLFNYYRLKDVPRLYWDFDVSYHPEVSFARAGIIPYDGYLVGNKYYVEEFSKRFKKPTLLLPYACSPHIHRRVIDTRFDNYLIGFIGSMTPERTHLIEICKKTTYNSANVFVGEGIFGDELVKATNKLDIMFHSNQDACKGLVPGRPWETTACGTTLMMDRTSYEDFCEFLPEHLHEDLLVYDNETDIRRLLHRWQDHRATLMIMGNSLMNYVHDHHSYKNRAERIIEWAKEQQILTH